MRSSATLTYCDIRYSQAKVIHRLVYESYALLCAQNLLNGMKSNLRGKPWKIYDQSGMTENVRYDFKGNLLETKRQFSQEYKQTIDWETNPAMENEEFVSTTEYDALNRATSIRTPRNSGEIMPEYDEGGLLKTVKAKLQNSAQATEFVKDITYNPKGQRERITYGNGATTKYEYDEKTFRLKQLLTTRNNGTDVLQDLNYTYDQMGNITGITDNAQQTIYFNGTVVNPSQNFEYDALYRLTKATGREHASINADSEPEIEGYNPAGISPEDGNAMRLYQRQWQYDNVGNILQLIHQANNNNWTRNYNYAANNNRLMSTENGNADVNYTYNEHGSMTAMPHLQNMQWDFAERLSHITRGTTEAYYNYDGRGQRVRKVVEKNNVVEERLYLGGFEIWRKKINGTLDTERETLHVMDDVKRIAIVETLTVNNGTIVNNPITVQRYQFSNNIESATLELDENANIISYEEYYPYGETSYRAGRNITETGQKRYRYTGKEKDEESGLYYYGARYYACWLGRWIATDPAGLVDGLNLYMYCSGNPLSKIDPSGMFDIETDTINKARRVFEPASTTVAKINIPSEQLTEIRPAVATQGGANFLMDKNFSTLDEAGKFAIENINQQSIDENVEMGGMIYEAEGRFYITSPYKSPNEDKINLPYISTAVISGEIPKIGKLVGMYHTHANSTKEIDMSFSSDDIDLMKDNKIVGYLGTNAKNAAGHKFFEGIQKFDPSKLSPTTPTFKIKEIGYIDYNEYVNYDINDDDFHKRIELAKYTKYANYYIKHIEFLIEKEVITNVK